MSSNKDHFRSNFVCVDANAEQHPFSDSANQDGLLIYPTEVCLCMCVCVCVLFQYHIYSQY